MCYIDLQNIFATSVRNFFHKDPGIKRPWRDADRSPPYSEEVRNGGAYNFTPPFGFMA
jgi:hypothetical protein